MEHIIKDYMRRSATVKETVAQESSATIAAMAQAIVKSLRSGGQVLAMGNGGSAADAQHFVAELVGRFRLERAAWPAIALTANSSNVTAIGNDYGYEAIFSRQVEAFCKPQDVVLGLSTSGRSANVIKAMDLAKEKGAVTMALTGLPGLPLADLCDHAVIVPEKATSWVQEVHITILHLLCYLVEEELVHGAS